jgi:hypothetical protein
MSEVECDACLSSMDGVHMLTCNNNCGIAMHSYCIAPISTSTSTWTCNNCSSNKKRLPVDVPPTRPTITNSLSSLNSNTNNNNNNNNNTANAKTDIVNVNGNRSLSSSSSSSMVASTLGNSNEGAAAVAVTPFHYPLQPQQQQQYLTSPHRPTLSPSYVPKSPSSPSPSPSGMGMGMGMPWSQSWTATGTGTTGNGSVGYEKGTSTTLLPLQPITSSPRKATIVTPNNKPVVATTYGNGSVKKQKSPSSAVAPVHLPRPVPVPVSVSVSVSVVSGGVGVPKMVSSPTVSPSNVQSTSRSTTPTTPTTPSTTSSLWGSFLDEDNNKRSSSSSSSRMSRSKAAVEESLSREENDALRAALANSLISQQSRFLPSSVPDAPTFHPTCDEFECPFTYLQRIKPEAEKYGVVKVVPPLGWKPPMALDITNFRFHTRLQKLHLLQQAAGFDSGHDYDWHSYRKQADEFEAKWRAARDRDTGGNSNNGGGATNSSSSGSSGSSGSSSSPRKASAGEIEHEYWRIVETGSSEVEVEYGNDIDSQSTGSVFGSDADNHLGSPLYQKYPSWNLGTIASRHGCVLRHLGEKVQGVSIPWIYCGMLFSSFCWHNEDNYLYRLVL